MPTADELVASMGHFNVAPAVQKPAPTGEEILAGMESAVAALRRAKRLVICHPDIEADLVERIAQEGLSGMVEVRSQPRQGRDQIYVMPIRWGKLGAL